MFTIGQKVVDQNGKVFVVELPFDKGCKVLFLHKVQLRLLGKVFLLFDKGHIF